MKTTYFILLITSVIYLNACGQAQTITESICDITTEICEYANAICMVNSKLPSSQQVPAEEVKNLMALRDDMRYFSINTSVTSVDELKANLYAVRERLRLMYKQMNTPGETDW